MGANFNIKRSYHGSEDFRRLFLDTLKDIYYAEKQILKALTKMARASQSEEGKAAFLKHKEQTEGQIERLQQVFELLGKPARGKTCEAIRRPRLSSTTRLRATAP